jgi:aminomethyltransferase
VGAQKILNELRLAPPRQRIGFTLDNRVIARGGATLHTDSGQKVGQVTSGTHSPNLNCGIGMGYVETSYISHPLYVNIRNTMHPITITKLPFVSHNYYRG